MEPASVQHGPDCSGYGTVAQLVVFQLSGDGALFDEVHRKAPENANLGVLGQAAGEAEVGGNVT